MFKDKNNIINYDKNQIRQLLIDNLNFVKSISVKEYTLYRKWSQLNTKENIKFYRKNISSIKKIKRNIWIPKDLNDYLNLNIKIIPVKTEEDNLTWKILRMYCSSAFWNGSPGRMAKFIVVNEINDKNADPFGFGIKKKKHEYLGIISLGSDFLSVGGRDFKIGWTQEQKFKGNLNYIAMASTIVPTQPLGYNFLGGKLITLLSCSDIVENFWNDKYKNEKLLGITTTSLYGGFSQYNGLKYWKKCKSTPGKIQIEPDDNVYEKLRIWFKHNYNKEYVKITSERTESGNVKSRPKNKILDNIKRIIGDVPMISAESSRGVYWCPLYENTESFLSDDTNNIGNKRFDNNYNNLIELWKEKYAKKRVSKFTNDDISSILYLDDLVENDWNFVNLKYLKGQ